MAVLLADLVSGAMVAAGKEDDPSISADRWRLLINQAIKTLWRKMAGQFADSWIATTDFTIASPATNVAAMPADFDHLRHVTKDPTLQSRQRIDPFSLANVDAYVGFPGYRVMGRKLYFEPPELAAGNYRAWYVPRPQLFGADFAVRCAIPSTIPTCNGGPPAGPGHNITAVANGVLPPQDGLTLAVGDRVLFSVLDEPTENLQASDLGIYVLVSAGSAGTRWQFGRAGDFDTASPTEVRQGAAVLVTAGTIGAGACYQLTAFAGAVDAVPQTWAIQQLDAALDPYDEYLEVYAAALALEGEKSDSSQQHARLDQLTEDIETMASSQEAGGQIAISDVEEFQDARGRRRHPLP